MTRGNIRAATSFVLIPVLVLQAACYRALGPPMPINPGDQAQRAAIERAERVKVVTVAGASYRLKRVELATDQLSGLTSTTAGGRTVIPIESISAVQAYETSQGWVALGGIVVVVGVLALLTARTSCRPACGPSMD